MDRRRRRCCSRRAPTRCATTSSARAILRGLNDVAAAVGRPILNALARFDPLPRDRRAAGRRARADARRSPATRTCGRPRDGVVQGPAATACGLGVEGSGWIAAPGLVVTNAHVVAGEDDTTVQLARRPAPQLDAHADRVRPATTTSPSCASTVSAAAAAARIAAASAGRDARRRILGFPRDGPFDVRAGRLGATQDGPDPGRLRPRPGARARSCRCAAACGPGTPAARWSTPTAACWRRCSPRPRRAPARRLRGPQRDGRARPARAGRRRSQPDPAPSDGRAARYPAATAMGKTLVIAEKPSVGQDLARVLPGPFQKHTGAGEKTERWLEGPEHIITWAVGHLVQLAEPDEYDDKYKKWRMADLPIVPAKFKLVVRDERSQKQMTVVTQAAQARRRRPRRQRLRRRPRGRADLRLPLREGRRRRSRSSGCGCRR